MLGRCSLLAQQTGCWSCPAVTHKMVLCAPYAPTLCTPSSRGIAQGEAAFKVTFECGILDMVWTSLQHINDKVTLCNKIAGETRKENSAVTRM